MSSLLSSSSGPTKVKRKRETEDSVDTDSSTSDYESNSQSDASPDLDKPNGSAEDDVPVLSHAAKRRQKNQAHRQTGNDADSGVPTKKRKLKDASAALMVKDAANGKSVKRQNSIWVGNMSFRTTEENLRMFFKDKGIGDITRLNMPTKVVKGPAAKGPGLRAENCGFAYVDFETLEAKQTAIALSEQPLLGRKLLIKDGDDYSGRPNQPTLEASAGVNIIKKSLSKSAQKILRNQTRPAAPTLFFGNLSFDTTEESIRDLLEAHREKKKRKGEAKEESLKEGENEDEPWIRKIRLGTFEDSGKCKGFAFVDFSATDFATSALINPKNHHLNGRDLVVEYASAEAVRRGARRGQKQTPRRDINGIPTEQAERRPKTTEDPPPQKYKPVEEREEQTPEDGIAPESFEKPSRPFLGRQRDKDRGRQRNRPKPGAALALAKRQSAAIVPSQGQKITF